MTRKHNQTKPEDTLAKLLPGDDHGNARRAALRMFEKSATDLGTTTNVSFAADLARHDLAALWQALEELSAMAQLQAIGVAISLDGLGSITVPMRGAGDKGSLKPAFVSEGSTIPVASATLGSTNLQRFKLGIISLLTQELIDVSNILDVVEDFILQDLAEGLDTYVFDPASTSIPVVRPAAITVGAPNQPSAGTTLANVMTDIAYIRSQLSNARRAAIVMHSDQMRALEMLQVDGRFPLEGRIASGNLWGLQLIHSPYVPRDNVVGVDAASFWSASDSPQIATRDSVTLAMASAAGADPAMKADGTAQDAVDDEGSIQISDAAGTTPATETRETFQTNSVAIRVIQPITWQVMPYSVCYVSGVGYAG